MSASVIFLIQIPFVYGIYVASSSGKVPRIVQRTHEGITLCLPFPKR